MAIRRVNEAAIFANAKEVLPFVLDEGSSRTQTVTLA
jgi:hypothetical protein